MSVECKEVISLYGRLNMGSIGKRGVFSCLSLFDLLIVFFQVVDLVNLYMCCCPQVNRQVVLSLYLCIFHGNKYAQ